MGKKIECSFCGIELDGKEVENHSQLDCIHNLVDTLEVVNYQLHEIKEINIELLAENRGKGYVLEQILSEKIQRLDENQVEQMREIIKTIHDAGENHRGVRCGWCGDWFEDRDAVRNHSIQCEHNPVAKELREKNELLELVYNMCPMDEDLEKQVKACLDKYDEGKK